MISTEKLALFGGAKAVEQVEADLFAWPVITEEDESAALEVLRHGAMSGTDITQQFELEFAQWLNIEYALGFNNGTAAIHTAMFGCGVGVGDEIICPSVTYWASALQAFSLGATVVFADIHPTTLCLDPADIEHRITEKTKAIVVVHYLSHPADMDPIIEIARRYNLKVIEDVSHAQGGLYKGRQLGTIGHVGAMSLMTGKSFAIGEAGMLVTKDRDIYDRAIAFGHYERFNDSIENEELKSFIGLPLGGYKYRMHQVSSAVGRVQLKYYEQRIAEIDKAMNYFWKQLEGVPGIQPHRPVHQPGSTNAGWYAARGLYHAEQLGGLSVTRFCEALVAEGISCESGCNRPLHLHPVFHTADIYGHGTPTRLANTERDLLQPAGSLPVAEHISERVFSIPWFKQFRPESIDKYVLAIRKVVACHKELLEKDPGNSPQLGGWHFFSHKA
ncbi:DegT/DnrJ/EryC1/StrS family aminotransferase [Paenibacillus eucommiae]|uniref:dTDP-4-amino-4,6-dideoxygalactose transaminase n=1 Tax=Paenibacillus eucommiae TaxID=1355755 RepID=A0ABS4IUH9_9BACL|nr:DegT/DnrJ/EryC1/StrS family aminotransferase [Paenibacillus eucommiae]MBP1990521.1 dTDP-4-amino-4,6-dideoxygalactose transaminase [Paenibacillus eucommiae]